jgi:hypothetical protein
MIVLSYDKNGFVKWCIDTEDKTILKNTDKNTCELITYTIFTDLLGVRKIKRTNLNKTTIPTQIETKILKILKEETKESLQSSLNYI